MTEVEDNDRGNPEKWVLLTDEESRCITLLKKYYVLNEDASEQSATIKAWDDIKREFPERLASQEWFKLQPGYENDSKN